VPEFPTVFIPGAFSTRGRLGFVSRAPARVAAGLECLACLSGLTSVASVDALSRAFERALLGAPTA
jgi:hypothetical protein